MCFNANCYRLSSFFSPFLFIVEFPSSARLYIVLFIFYSWSIDTQSLGWKKREAHKRRQRGQNITNWFPTQTDCKLEATAKKWRWKMPEMRETNCLATLYWIENNFNAKQIGWTQTHTQSHSKKRTTERENTNAIEWWWNEPMLSLCKHFEWLSAFWRVQM